MHLCEYQDPEGVVGAAQASKTTLVSSCIDFESSLRTLSLAKEHPEIVVPYVGVHPSKAGKEEDLGWVGEALSKAEGVGEIGLDPKYAADSPMKSQRRVFTGLLSAAERAEKPVQVHSRGAEADCLEVLSSFRPRAVLLHWFQAEELLRVAGDRSYYVSFGPAIITSAKLQRMVKALDRSLLLVESDGPVPFAALGGAKGPTLIPSVVFRVSEAWGTPFQECAEQVLANSLAYLGARTKG
jgi:TatD DNase family protein